MSQWRTTTVKSRRRSIFGNDDDHDEDDEEDEEQEQEHEQQQQHQQQHLLFINWIFLNIQKQRWLLAFKKTNQNTQVVKYERFLI